jgi:large subunit ribosomal protein L4e
MAHGPEPEKVWSRKMNRKEKRAALRGALAATSSPEAAKARGHKFDARLPLVADDGLEALERAAEVRTFLEAAGLWPDVERASVRKVRAGKGKMRGRKMKKRRSVLFVVSKAEALRGACNLPGVEVVTVDGLRTENLAPGGHPGRLTVYTRSALHQIEQRYGATRRPAGPPAAGKAREAS